MNEDPIRQQLLEQRRRERETMNVIFGALFIFDIEYDKIRQPYRQQLDDWADSIAVLPEIKINDEPIRDKESITRNTINFIVERVMTAITGKLANLPDDKRIELEKIITPLMTTEQSLRLVERCK